MPIATMSSTSRSKSRAGAAAPRAKRSSRLSPATPRREVIKKRKRGDRSALDRAWCGQVRARLAKVTAGYTFHELGELMGFFPETVRRYLRHGSPRAEFVAAVCQTFGVSATWVLLGKGGPDDQ